MSAASILLGILSLLLLIVVIVLLRTWRSDARYIAYLQQELDADRNKLAVLADQIKNEGGAT